MVHRRGILSISKSGKRLSTIVLLVCLVLIPSISGGVNSQVNISTLQIQWNPNNKQFEALFSVTNSTPKDLELSSILRFRTKARRHWRGALLPLVKGKSTEHFKINFTPDLMLKNDYTDIAVILYEKRYLGFLDNTSNYVQIKSQRFIVDDNYHVKLISTRITSDTTLETKVEERVFNLGSAVAVSSPQKKVVKKRVKLQALVKPPSAPETEKKPIESAKPAAGGTWVTIDPLKVKKTVVQQAVETKQIPESLEVLQQPVVKETEPAPVSPQKPTQTAEIEEVTPESPASPEITQGPASPESIPAETAPLDQPLTIAKLEIPKASREQITLEIPKIAETPILIPKKVIQAPKLDLVKAADGNIELKWTSKAKANQFNIYWSDIPLITKENSTKIGVQGKTFTHQNIINGKKYYYAVAAAIGEDESPLSNEIEAISQITAIVETPIEDFLAEIYLDDFSKIDPIEELTIDIADTQVAQQENLKRAKALEELDIQSREKLISLFIAEGKSEGIAELLSDQLDKDPENLNLSLSLSKVYHEQGDTAAALDVLTASLNRISLSARLALNQELKTSVKEGETTIKGQSEEAFLANEFSKLGTSLLDSEKYTEALSAFQSLHSLAQDYPFLQHYMGLCRRGLKQYNQAKRHFIAQGKQKNDVDNELVNLDQLTEVLPFSLELQDVDFAIGKYKAVIPGLQGDKKTEADQQLEKLSLLMVKARDRKFGNLADLMVKLPEEFRFSDIQPGQDIVVKLAVDNVGKRSSADFNVYYQLKHESGIFFDVPGTDRFQGIAANGPSFSWAKRLTLPQKAIKGRYQLVVNIEQDEGKEEITLNNNTLSTASNIEVIEPIAELALSFRERPTLIRVNRKEGIVVDLVVTNNGYLPSPEYEIQYWLESRDGRILKHQDPTVYSKIKKRDRFLIKNKRINIPVDFEEGDYKLQAKLILKNEAAEINKKNNAVESDFAFVLPDRFEDRPADGVEHFTRLVSLDPDTLRYRVKVSRYMRIMQENDQALSTLNKASVHVAERRYASAEPPQFRDLDLLKKELKEFGEAYYKVNAYQNALTNFQSLRTIDPDYPNIHRLIGNCRIGLGQYTLAKKDFLAQALRSPDYQSLTELKTALSFGNDVDNMVKTRDAFRYLLQKAPQKNKGQINQQIAELDTMIVNARRIMARQGSDLIVDIENPPALVAIKPNDILDLEFSLNNLGQTLSNPVTVHYQFIDRNGNIYDTNSSTGFDDLDPRHETVYWDEELVVPENIVGGIYQIRAALEFEKNRGDKNEFNNQVKSEFLFKYSEPDIVINTFRHQIRRISAESTIITTQLTWENQGGNPATNNTLKLYLENFEDRNDVIPLHEEFLEDVPAISETIIMSHQLETPKIESDKQYRLIAEIVTEGNLKEHKTHDNRYVSNGTFGREMSPVVMTQLNLKDRIIYPGKEVDLEVHLRNNQLKEEIKNVDIEFSLKNQQGVNCCASKRNLSLIPPSLSVADELGNVRVKDFIFKTTLMFPQFPKGEYQVQAQILSTANLDLISSQNKILSPSRLLYGSPALQIASFYPARDVLIPGGSNFFILSVKNDGNDKSKPEKISFHLEGQKTYVIDEVTLDSLDPSAQSETLGKFVKIPQGIERGSYALVLKKKETNQGPEQTLRYRNVVKVHDIQPLAPQEFESFKQNEVPVFSWNSADDLSYRLAFSTDPAFENEAAIFRIPDNEWINEREYQPLVGEWSIIWLLSQNLKQDVFWLVEAKSIQDEVIKGIPQKIQLKQGNL